MPTNDSELLEKVLSKWEQIDKNWQVIDTSDCSDMGEEGENPECDEQLCLKHQKMYRTEVVEMIESEAKADTANEIFAKLDKVVWQQVEASRLKEFLIQFSNAKDEEAALKVATAFSIIGLDAEKYEALKKQYKVD